MLAPYRNYLQSLSYEQLLTEALTIWAINDPEQYDQNELIEVLVGKDEESQFL